MNEIRLECSRVLPGPPGLVWELLTDWEHQDDWMLEASDVVVTSDHREGEGVEAEATVRIGGLRMRDRIKVRAWEPPRRLVIEHLGWVKGTGELRLSPLPDGSTRIDWVEALRPPLGPLGSAGLRLYAPLLRRTFARDLRVLEGVVRAAARRN